MSASPAHEPRQAPMPRRAKARSPRADRFPRLPLCVLSAEPAILFRHRLMGYVLALLISGVSALLILLLVWRFPAFHLEGVLLMAGIVAVALTWGAGPGLFATCVSTGLLAFVVLPPHFSWQLQDPTEWVDVVVLLVGGVGASLLASQSARVRRRAEALAAQMSEAQSSSDLERLRLRALVDALPVPVALLDTQEQMLEFNPALQTFLGVPRPPRTLADCQQAKAWWPATGQPVTPRAWPIARAALTGEYVTNEEIELETADGQRKVVLDSATPIRDMRGDMHGAVGVFQDMTEHKRLEGALRQAQQDAEARARELEAIFEALTDGLLVYDAQGLILHSNTAARGLFGFEAQPEFAFLPWQERASRYGSRDAEGKRVPSEDLVLSRLLRGEVFTSAQAADQRLQTPDGREVTVSFTGRSLRDARGAISGAVVIVRDVTERRRLEARQEAMARLFEATFEQAAVGIAHIGLDGRFLRFNTRLCEITGYRREDLSALSFQAITHPDDLGADLAYVRQMLEGSITTFTMDKRYLRPDGSSVWAHLTVALLRAPGGAPECFISVVEDISARKAAEAALVASEAQLQQSVARLQAVLEVLPVGVVMTNPAGGFLQLNQTFKQVWGEEAPLSKSVAEYQAYRGWWPDGRRVAPEEWGAALALERGETVLGQEIEIETFTGERKHIDNSAVPICSPDGTLMGAAVALLDITERKRLERQLRAANVQLAQAAQAAQERATEVEAMLEAMTDGVLVYNRDGHIVRTNQALDVIIGFQANPAYRSLPLEERLRRLVIRNGQGELLPLDQTPQMRLAQGETIRMGEAEDIQVRTPDGRDIMLDAAGAPLRDATGAITGAVMVFRDVTGRRRLERQTREALEALLQMAEVLVQRGPPTDQRASENQMEVGRVAHQLADLTRVVLGCKRVSVIAFAQETGQLRPLALAGFPSAVEAGWFQAVPQFTASSSFPASLLERLEAGEVLVHDRTCLEHLQPPVPGSEQTMLAPMLLGQQLLGILRLDYGSTPHQPTPTDHALAGAVAKLAALVLERERLFGEREEARASALAEHETTRQMSDFLSLIGHELRTPLTSLKGQAQLAQRQVARMLAGEDALPGVTEEVLTSRLGPLEDKLQRLSSPMGRLERLINDLLEAAYLQRGQFTLAVRPCELGAVVRDAVEAQHAAWPERAIDLRVPEGEEVVVRADAERVGQVVTNYLTNALKYTPSDSPVTVTLSVEAGWGQIAVHDRGPGIPLEEQASLWEQFRRGRRAGAQNSSAGGLGLGLYLCKQLIERQGGQVGLESQPGAGSTFWLRLPLAAPPG